MADLDQVVLARIAGAARAMIEIAHDPRNWFTAEDDKAVGKKIGFVKGRKGEPDKEVLIWPLLTHREPENKASPLSMLFHYTVMAPRKEGDEPIRRLTIRQHVNGAPQADALQKHKPDLWRMYGYNVLAYQWFPQSYELAVELTVSPLVPVLVGDQVTGYTPITWNVLLNHKSMTVPALARRPVPTSDELDDTGDGTDPQDEEAARNRAMDGDA